MCTHSIFGNKVPIKLDGVIDDAGQIAYDQIHVGNLRGIFLYGMALTDVENVLGYR